MKTKTSITSPIGINKIASQSSGGCGWVAITLAPGKQTTGTYNYWDRDLDRDLDRLRELGTTTLIPFLEDDELRRLEIPNLIESAKSKGFTVGRFPFHDGGIPKDMDSTIEMVDDIISFLNDGERIVMHCNGGLGRAGTMAACVRLALGLDKTAKAAIASVRKIRSRRAIETRTQEDFIAKFADEFQKEKVG